jgi:hypothetical protein
MRRSAGYFGLGIVALGGWLWWHYAPDPSLIELGASEARVVKLLGPPTEVTAAPRQTAWGLQPVVYRVNSGDCVREFSYRRGEAEPRERWYVGFDAQGRVVSSYGYRPKRSRGVNKVEQFAGVEK